MRRLAIIDLQGGWQPLYNEDRTLILVANGEIYNFIELRNSLEQRGHRFATGSDCEVIVHLYEEYGLECARHLRGMFAFALVDLRKNELVIVRDRLGEKPLAFAQSDDGFVFCSEVGGLIAGGLVPFQFDPSSVVDYFHWHFIPEPATAVRGVYKLDAGSWLSVDLTSGRLAKGRYWCLEDAPPVEGNPVDLVRAELHQIAGFITRSDVPVGVGLSGGIDSSAIAALCRNSAKTPLTAFTVGYEGATWQDERGQAKEFAEWLGIPCVETRLRTDRVVSDFARLCGLRDDPLVDISSSGFLALYELARESGVRVLLAGQGSDELFWGYKWFRNAVRATRRKATGLAQLSLRSYLSIIPPPISITGLVDWLEDGAGLLKGVRAWQRDSRSDPEELVFWNERGEYRAAAGGLPKLMGPAIREAVWRPQACFVGADLWRDIDTSMTTLLCKTFLQSNGLVMCDRLSMAAGVEGRLPFTDYRLAELVVGLRKRFGDCGTRHKPWLMQALNDDLPSFVLTRRKRGFTPPWRSWLREITRSWGPALTEGQLVGRGVLDRNCVRSLSTVSPLSLRPTPMLLASIVLELWAVAMARLEKNAKCLAEAVRDGLEPELLDHRGLDPSIRGSHRSGPAIS